MFSNPALGDPQTVCVFVDYLAGSKNVDRLGFLRTGLRNAALTTAFIHKSAFPHLGLSEHIGPQLRPALQDVPRLPSWDADLQRWWDGGINEAVDDSIHLLLDGGFI